MKKPIWYVLIILVAVLVVFALVRNREGKYLAEPYVREKVLMDTLVTIKAYGADNVKTEEAVDRALSEIEGIDRIMNFYDPQSEISKINKGAGRQRVISRNMLTVIPMSQRYNRKTGGAFDITIGPLMRLWSFNVNPRVPSEKELRKALSLVDAGGIEISRRGNSVRLRKSGMELDLGGVAKGYAVDRAVAVLRKSGIRRALVTTGSTTIVMGGKPGGKPWLIGIKNPRKDDKTIGTLKLKDKSISTSGDYQQYFMKAGKRYHHIIDPKTGLPARGVQSVTIVTTKSCTEADILSTAVFVMGYPKGMDFLANLGDTQGVIVDSKGKVHMTAGLEEKLEGAKSLIRER